MHNGGGSNLCLDIGNTPWQNPCSLEPAKSMPMCDTSLTFAQRVANLVGNLSLSEKMGCVVFACCVFSPLFVFHAVPHLPAVVCLFV